MKKSTRRATPARAIPHDQRSHCPSLEERVAHVCRLLTLIRAAASVDADLLAMDEDEISDSIAEASREAAEAIEPLRHAPGAIANWAPATRGA